MNTTQELLDYAELNANKAQMYSSAIFCIKQAKKCLLSNDDNAARYWSLTSIQYSCGILDSMYKSNK